MRCENWVSGHGTRASCPERLFPAVEAYTWFQPLKWVLGGGIARVRACQRSVHLKTSRELFRNKSIVTLHDIFWKICTLYAKKTFNSVGFLVKWILNVIEFYQSSGAIVWTTSSSEQVLVLFFCINIYRVRQK